MHLDSLIPSFRPNYHVKFFVTFATKVDVFNILRQNVTNFDIGNFTIFLVASLIEGGCSPFLLGDLIFVGKFITLWGHYHMGLAFARFVESTRILV